jgi:hypothetical protein
VSYTDDGDSPIYFVWTTHGTGDHNASYINKQYELFFDYPGEFVTDEGSSVSIDAYSSEPSPSMGSSSHRTVNKGDRLGAAPINRFYLQHQYSPVIGSMRFLSRRFHVMVHGLTKSGKLTFKKINMYGVINRNSVGR